MLSLCLLPLLSGCDPSHAATTITDADLAHDESGKHVTSTFKPTDHTIYVVGWLNGPGSGVKMKAVWTQVNAGGVKNKVLTENDFTVEGTTSAISGHITRNTDWPVGTYRTELYFDGRVDKTLEWQVK